MTGPTDITLGAAARRLTAGPRRRRATLLAAVAVALGLTVLLLGASGAGAAGRAPHVYWVHCYPRACSGHTVRVHPGDRLRVAASPLAPRMQVLFATARRGHPHAVTASPAGSRRLIVRVPSDAYTGRITVRAPHGRVSNPVGPVVVVRLPARPRAVATAFSGTGMWIWELPNTEGGNLGAIIRRAHAHRVSTVFLKSSDGQGSWSQFSAANVATLKAGGLHVCAWQYVYGNHPYGEAQAGARAVQNGADCLVIDAESEYEGKYAQAQEYLHALRSAVGPSYPLGLAGFPYVDYHPAYPYSVFLGPGGAQFNVPQMYWRDIGTTVDSVFSHTYLFNRPYSRPIEPLGQLWQSPPASEIQRFRTLAAANGAAGVSWWDWQEASSAGFDAIGRRLATPAAAPDPGWPVLTRGARGDLVVWAQEHLQGAGLRLAVDGDFGPGTQSAVRSFQSSHGLRVTGRVDSVTWPVLLRSAVATPAWAGHAARAAGAGGSRRTGPPTAALPAKRDEIHPHH